MSAAADWSATKPSHASHTKHQQAPPSLPDSESLSPPPRRGPSDRLPVSRSLCDGDGRVMNARPPHPITPGTCSRTTGSRPLTELRPNAHHLTTARTPSQHPIGARRVWASARPCGGTLHLAQPRAQAAAVGCGWAAGALEVRSWLWAGQG